eukprot:Rmarinus@m.10535
MKRGFGVVFDVDGVFVRGKKAIPGARTVLETLDKHGIPYVFLTNHGSCVEETRARTLGKTLDYHIPVSRMILAHTPLQDVASQYADGLVLATGVSGDNESIKTILHQHGFPRVMTTREYLGAHPLLVPNRASSPPDGPAAALASEPVRAFVVAEIPEDWHVDLQLCCDVMLGNGRVDGTAGDANNTDGPIEVPVYVCNFDFVYSAEYSRPRLGPGAFCDCLDTVYAKMSGGKSVSYRRYGKPYAAAFNYATKRIKQQVPEQDVSSFYMVGDNPKSDVRGANANGLFSILVRTGCFQGGENDTEDPAQHVVADVVAALKVIFEREGLQL